MENVGKVSYSVGERQDPRFLVMEEGWWWRGALEDGDHTPRLVESAAKDPEERSLFVLYPAVSTSKLARFWCGSNGRASRFHVMSLSSRATSCGSRKPGSEILCTYLLVVLRIWT